MKKALLLFVVIFLFALPLMAKEKGVTINDVKLSPKNLPAGWALISEEPSNSKDLAALEKKLDAELFLTFTQNIAAKPTVVKIKYIGLKDGRLLDKAGKKLLSIAGKNSSVCVKANYLIQIDSKDKTLRDKATGALKPDKVIGK